MKNEDKLKEQTVKKKSSRRKYIIVIGIIFCILGVYVYWLTTWRSENSLLQKESEILIRKIAARNLQKEPDQLNDEDFSKVTRLIIGEHEWSSAPLITELADIKLLEKFTNLEILSLGRIIYPKKGTPKWMIILSKYGFFDIKKRFALDLSPLAKLQNLKSLTICDTSVKNINSLANLVNLQKLDLSGTNIQNIEPVKNLINIERLVLDGTAIVDLKPIKNLKKLEYLRIMRTKVNNLEPLRNLTNLQTFYAYETKISNLEPLKRLTNLRRLYISGSNNISNQQIEDLQKVLPNLEIEK